ncbi:hypothetical protein C1H46_035912 [Malus baccata]|uniref:Uncharacterized protein n=1 Tax=Malus baccata TaxID=106549 RepID=A0A540KWD4_MALBA|nr:hypothetical protein C1H46_035912 [Malus baccata]
MKGVGLWQLGQSITRRIAQGDKKTVACQYFTLEVELKKTVLYYFSEKAWASSFSSPPRLPTRLKQRLSLVDSNKTPTIAEQIQTKLRLANLRRQEHYEKLSSKAQEKPRNPSRSSSEGEDLG